MNQLVILPAHSGHNQRGERLLEATIDFLEGQPAAFRLQLIDGQWSVADAAAASSQACVARLCYQSLEGGTEWFLLDPSGQLSVNEQPTLGIQRIAPGDLICRGHQSWFVAQRVSPQPAEAPESVREKICPMCGDKLGAAPVVSCSCGRFLHLERPDAPGDESALNCFLISKVCGNCGQPTTLQPQLVPEPPQPLRPYRDDDLDFVSEELEPS